MQRLLIALVACVCVGVSVRPSDAAVAHVASNFGLCASNTNTGVMNGTCGNVVTETFAWTPAAINNGLLVSLSCADTSGTPSAVTLTATGWTTTQIGAITGSNTAGFIALFRAYAPNTSAATFTFTWTATNCGASGFVFMNALIGEFSGVDTTNFVDASVLKTATTGGCPTGTAGNGVTPTVANDGVWFACNDLVTAALSGYTAGANDGQGDWTEWKILAGGSGTEQFSAFTTTGAYTMAGVAIKPAAGATSPPTLTLLGVGKAAP